MIRGIISGISAMRAQLRNQEVIANNLANADTAAYNRDKVVFSTFNDILMYALQPSAFPQAIGAMSSGTVVQDVETIRSVGPIENTGNPLDVALRAGEYLLVETTSGTRYTRRGDLRVSGDGYLTVGGYRVLGSAGPIKFEGCASKSIREDGTVMNGDNVVDSLSMVTFQDESLLVKEGNSLFNPASGGPVLVTTVSLMQGALEKSSVDPVSEMVSLIYTMRAYEAAQRAIRSHDETLEQAVSRVGSVA
jgi:flagellar basal body rod protein FlgG